MRSVLGIDAPWTKHARSGVALVAEDAHGWRCLAVAPSYESFVSLADGQPVNWSQRHPGTSPDVSKLIVACQKLRHGNIPTAVAVDMPLSRVQITGRRAADDSISKEFGGRGCSTHSPSPQRPGKIGEVISSGFLSYGFHLATADAKCGAPRALLEVYPHPAILTLLSESYRFKYKVSKSRKYWPNLSIDQRYNKLSLNFLRILKVLTSKKILIGHDYFPFPPPGASKIHLSNLKPYEDALDALICAWVGIEYLEKKAKAYGDNAAAIWVPV